MRGRDHRAMGDALRDDKRRLVQSARALDAAGSDRNLPESEEVKALSALGYLPAE